MAKRRPVKMSAWFSIHVSRQKRTVLTTHHRCYFSSSVVVDAGQHNRRQEEEEGAGSSVHQVLQEDAKTHITTPELFFQDEVFHEGSS